MPPRATVTVAVTRRKMRTRSRAKAASVLAGVMTPEADDAAALLAKAVSALIAKIESNTATRTSLVIRAEEIDAQNEELGRTIEVMTATIDTLRGQN